MRSGETFEEFFRRYARVSMGAEPEKLAAFYDANFLVGGPKGTEAFKNDPAFLDWLRKVHAYNESSGLTAMKAAGVSDFTIGGGYTLATVEWAATFKRTGEKPIRFSISYLLRQAEGAWKIAGYVSHEDQEETMREHGLA